MYGKRLESDGVYESHFTTPVAGRLEGLLTFIEGLTVIP